VTCEGLEWATPRLRLAAVDARGRCGSTIAAGTSGSNGGTQSVTGRQALRHDRPKGSASGQAVCELAGLQPARTC